MIMTIPPEESQMMHRRLQWKWEPLFLAEKKIFTCLKLSSSESRSGLCGNYQEIR